MVPRQKQPYKELTEKQKRHVLGALLAMREDGVLPRGSMAKIAKNLGVAPKSVSRLWRAAKTSREDPQGAIHTPDVSCKKGHRNQYVVYYREEVMEQITSSL